MHAASQHHHERVRVALLLVDHMCDVWPGVAEMPFIITLESHLVSVDALMCDADDVAREQNADVAARLQGTLRVAHTLRKQLEHKNIDAATVLLVRAIGGLIQSCLPV